MNDDDEKIGAQETAHKFSTPNATTTTNITNKEINNETDLNLNDSDDSSGSIQLDVVGFRMCQVIVPVSLCSIYVAILIRVLEWGTDRSTNIIDTTWSRLGLGVARDVTFGDALVNNTIIVAVFALLIVLVSLIILFVFYMEWHHCLSYYFYIPSFLIMAILTPIYIRGVLASLNWFGVDMITMLLFIWNFTALGMIAIFSLYTRGPLYVQQFYLIHNSAILAVVIIKALPSWAPWLLLFFLVFWDLFAVLAPCGPLNMIINLAEREGMVDMPGLVYTTDVTMDQPQEDQPGPQQVPQSTTTTNRNQQEQGNQSVQNQPTNSSQANGGQIERDEAGRANMEGQHGATQIEPVTKELTSIREYKRKNIEERGVNIGLGDFIFYSLLTGLTARGRQREDFYVVLASLDAILVGLVMTLIILVVTRRALPALPISIALGIAVSGITSYYVPDFSNKLAHELIFI